jgi:long-chain acyl-CoA synthetase
LLLEHAAARPHAPALREKEYGIWQTLTWSQVAQLVREIAAGLAQAGLQHGQHIVVVGENRPRLYASMLAAQAIGAVPVPLYQDAVATEYVFPLDNAEVGYAIVEDQEQVDKLLEVCAAVPALARIWYDDRAACALREPARGARRAVDRRPAIDAPTRCFDARSPRSRTTWRAVLHLRTRPPEGRRAQHFRADARRRAALRQADRRRGGAGLPAAAGSAEHLPTRSGCLRLRRQLPEVGSTVRSTMKEIGPTYYFAPPRVFEGCSPGDDPHGRRRRAQALAVPRFMDVARRVGPARMDGKPVGALDRCSMRSATARLRPAAQHARPVARARGLHRGRGDRPDLFTFYRSIGINLKQLYGSTETAVFVCLQPDHEVQADTVGVPIDGVEISVAESARSCALAGPAEGLLQEPQATADVLTPTAGTAPATPASSTPAGT